MVLGGKGRFRRLLHQTIFKNLRHYPIRHVPLVANNVETNGKTVFSEKNNNATVARKRNATVARKKNDTDANSWKKTTVSDVKSDADKRTNGAGKRTVADAIETFVKKNAVVPGNSVDVIVKKSGGIWKRMRTRRTCVVKKSRNPRAEHRPKPVASA